jgi:ubiquinone/menaquinone biosynthesis C-methylase UbiE
MRPLIFLSPARPDFEHNYLALREKEGRVLSDEQVKYLPDAGFDPIWRNEWALRQKTARKMLAYLSGRSFKNALDLGCGNGWFSARLAQIPGLQVTGLDVNQPELEQAVRVFGNTNPSFYYGDILDNIFDEKKFDLIVINASVQYFSDFKGLIIKLLGLLADHGEIHILDSPFYAKSEVTAAKKRSLDYYTSMGFAEMADYYYHHSTNDLASFQAEFLYKPSKNIFFKFLRPAPFPWIRITKA